MSAGGQNYFFKIKKLPVQVEIKVRKDKRKDLNYYYVQTLTAVFFFFTHSNYCASFTCCATCGEAPRTCGLVEDTPPPPIAEPTAKLAPTTPELPINRS